MAYGHGAPVFVVCRAWVSKRMIRWLIHHSFWCFWLVTFLLTDEMFCRKQLGMRTFLRLRIVFANATGQWHWRSNASCHTLYTLTKKQVFRECRFNTSHYFIFVRWVYLFVEWISQVDTVLFLLVATVERDHPKKNKLRRIPTGLIGG